jgi:hypothetical protein
MRSGIICFPFTSISVQKTIQTLTYKISAGIAAGVKAAEV